MTLLQRIEDLVTGSSLNPEFQKLRYLITGLITVVIGSILLFNGVALANNLNNSNVLIRRKNQLRILKLPEEPNLQNYERQNQSDLRQKIEQEFLQTSLIILIVIVFLSYLSLYYLLKPLSDNINRRENFVARASHELRTPLAILFSEFSLGVSLNKIEPIKQILTESKDEILRLQQLADRLLSQDNDQISPLKKSTNHETNLDLILSVWNQLKKNYKSTQLEYNQDEINRLNLNLSEPSRQILIEELFWNVLDNAFKHGDTDKPTIIKIKDNQLIISNQINNQKSQNTQKIHGLTICLDICQELGWKFSTKIQSDLFLIEIKVTSL